MNRTARRRDEMKAETALNVIQNMIELGTKNRSIDANRFRKAIWTNLLWIAWAIWWGGLSFYAIIVVPIGTELIGGVEQGFITQRVTLWHNGLSISFVICLAIEAYSRKSRVLWVVFSLLMMIDIALVVGHAKLTSQMDFKQQSVPSGFYAQHASYLWITAVEWVIGMAIPLCLMPQSTKNVSDGQIK